MATAPYMTAPKQTVTPTAQNTPLKMQPGANQPGYQQKLQQQQAQFAQQQKTFAPQIQQMENTWRQSMPTMSAPQSNGPMPSGMTNGNNSSQSYQPMGQVSTTGALGGGGAQPGNWNPTMPTAPAARQSVQAGYAAPQSVPNFFSADKNLFNPEAYKDNDAMTPNYISSVLPVAQFAQNNYQYATDFNEAQRRWDAEYAATQGQNQYQQGLSTRQQQMAEWQAQQAASQWGQQFGHTQYMDQQGLNLQQQQIGNNFTMGMDQNQATRDVANTYANSNMYQANQQLAGQRYMSDQERIASMYGADQGLRQAGLYSDAQRYAAQLGLQEAQGYASAQRYGADQTFAGQRYTTDAQERMNQLMMQNNLQTAAMQTYGRSQAPMANWARSWG